jgi:hypothetical protein
VEIRLRNEQAAKRIANFRFDMIVFFWGIKYNKSGTESMFAAIRQMSGGMFHVKHGKADFGEKGRKQRDF